MLPLPCELRKETKDTTQREGLDGKECRDRRRNLEKFAREESQAGGWGSITWRNRGSFKADAWLRKNSGRPGMSQNSG